MNTTTIQCVDFETQQQVPHSIDIRSVSFAILPYLGKPLALQMTLSSLLSKSSLSRCLDLCSIQNCTCPLSRNACKFGADVRAKLQPSLLTSNPACRSELTRDSRQHSRYCAYILYMYSLNAVKRLPMLVLYSNRTEVIYVLETEIRALQRYP